MSETARMMKRSPAWAELPFEITANILHRLGTVEILETAQYVCKSWHSVCNNPSMWRVITDLCLSGRQSNDLRKLCGQAVDLSQGQLVDINLENFGNDKLLDYIAETSKKLRRLRLACCHDLSAKNMVKAIEKFRNLEELHIEILTIPTMISETVVESIGRWCPLLRSFVLNNTKNAYGYESNDKVAYAIARSMQQLRRLELCGNGLSTDKGLKAILDGCPWLESLHLKSCYHVQLEKAEKLCSSTKLKCLKWTEYNLERVAVVAESMKISSSGVVFSAKERHIRY